MPLQACAQAANCRPQTEAHRSAFLGGCPGTARSPPFARPHLIKRIGLTRPHCADAVRDEVLCAGDGLGAGCIQVDEVLPLWIFADPTSVQNIEKKSVGHCAQASRLGNEMGASKFNGQISALNYQVIILGRQRTFSCLQQLGLTPHIHAASSIRSPVRHARPPRPRLWPAPQTGCCRCAARLKAITSAACWA